MVEVFDVVIQVYEQMSIAVEREATRLWILNVGDLKPYERETEVHSYYLSHAPQT